MVETVAPFKEVVEEIKAAGGETFKRCFQCGLCDAACPWNRVKDFSIRKIIREAAFGLTEVEGEEIWHCTTCGSCPSKCPRGVEQIELGVSLRKVASAYEVFPASVKSAAAVRAGLRIEGNPLEANRADRAKWAEGESVPLYEEGMAYLYFVGCYLSYDPRLKKVAKATAKILNQAGIQFGILGTAESCCGESVRKTGGEAVWRRLAKENIKNFVDRGVQKIIVSSPHCYETFKNEYPELRVNFEVVHIAELIADLLHSGRLELKREYAKRVTFHDPCYLGRHNGVYDAPRAVLSGAPGLMLAEMADHHQNSLCCGGGGGRIWMDTPKGERFSDLRLRQAKDVDADVLATACPYCITMFEDSRLNLAYEDTLEIKDITEIIAEVV